MGQFSALSRRFEPTATATECRPSGSGVFRLALALTLTLALTAICSGQDDSPASCRYFARDDGMIFVVSARADEINAHFYQFSADPKQRYQEAWSQGTAEAGALVTPKGQNKSDGIAFAAKPWPASGRISIEVKNWQSKSSADGDYEPIDLPKALQLAQKHFDEADKSLNEMYQSIVRGLPQEAVATLRSFQRDWIDSRDPVAENTIRFNWGSLTDEDEKALVLIQRALLTWDRVDFLKGTPKAMVAPGHNGAYQDAANRSVRVLEEASKVRFSITAFNARNGSTGDLTGEAPIKGNRVAWKEDEKSDPPAPPAQVTLTFKPFGVIEVQTKNAESFHGVGVEFDGKYLRSSSEAPKIDE
jgi:uncharacterized protein YecT (DUF1311 family)